MKSTGEYCVNNETTCYNNGVEEFFGFCPACWADLDAAARRVLTEGPAAVEPERPPAPAVPDVHEHHHHQHINPPQPLWLVAVVSSIATGLTVGAWELARHWLGW